MTTWRFRHEWGAVPARSATRRRDAIVGVTLHHTTGATLRASDATTDQWVRNIQHEHMHARGYADIAYNALVDADGTIYEGRANGVVGAHAASRSNVANRTTLGLAVLGNGDTITPEQIEGIRAYLYVVVASHIARPCRVFGHRDWMRQGGTATYCPSNRVEAMATGFDHTFGER